MCPNSGTTAPICKRAHSLALHPPCKAKQRPPRLPLRTHARSDLDRDLDHVLG